MASKTINTILNLKDKLSPGLDDATEAIKRMNKENATAARAWVSTSNAFSRDVANIKKKTAELAKDAIKMSGAVLGSMAAIAGGIGFSEAMDLEGYKTQLVTATKDTEEASRLMQNAVKLANSTPFEAGPLVEATAKFEAMGLSADRWLALTGDMAAGTNKDLVQAAEAIIDAQTGELERLKEFGITKAKIQEQADKMFGENQTINNKGQITNQENFNKALEQLMTESFSGGMEAQSKTVSGTLSTITGNFKIAMANLLGMQDDGTVRTGSFIDILKGYATTAAETFVKWNEDGTLEEIATKFDEGIKKAIDFAKVIGTNLSNAFTWAKENADLLKIALGLVLSIMVVSKVVSFVQSMIGLYNAVKMLYTGYMLLYGAKIKDKILTIQILGLYAKDYAMLIAKKGAMIAVKTAQIAWSAATKTMTAVQWALNAAMNANPIGLIIIAIAAVIAIGIALWKNWDTVKAKALELWEGIKNTFAPVGEFFSNVWEGAKTGFKTFINFIIDGMNLFNRTLNWIPTTLSKVPGFSWAANFTLPEIPKFALGTSYFKGGLAQINERGGEIVNLPNGSKVIPNSLSKRETKNFGGHNITININGSNLTADEVIDLLISRLKKVLAVV